MHFMHFMLFNICLVLYTTIIKQLLIVPTILFLESKFDIPISKEVTYIKKMMSIL